MKPVLALILFAVAAPACARDEDAAHRADRLATQALNARSPNGYAHGGRVRPQDEHDYEEARADYRRRLAAWRARVAACEAGRYDACR